MTLSAAESIYKASPQDKQPLRSELKRQIAEYKAKGGSIEEVAPGPVKWVPHQFTIKPERLK